MNITEVTAGYREKRQLKQYELSAEVYAQVTASIDEGEPVDEVHAELTAVAKREAGAQMRQRVAEHKMQEEIERDD